MRVIVLLIAAFAAVLSAGCASTPEEPPTAEELYDTAHELQRQANYEQSSAKFDELISTYPASKYSQQAMLDIIYLSYQRIQYAETLDAADRFIKAYPDNKSVAYALYMQGLSYFREQQSLVDRFGSQDPTERNPETMRQAFFLFKQLVEQYPNSEYVEDATLRMRYLINALSRHEIHIANYYLRRNAPIAAVGRAKRVLDIYRDSTATEDALTVLARAYKMMGASEELDKVYRLLKLNFPQNPLVAEVE